uniref:Uncharacterized protein n=1 Tax=Panagrolaimus superbus TaxID=310955 RepID=A0A914Y0S3_9BILA
MHMGFGKRSTVPFYGLDSKRAASGFSQFHMGLGKRANELNDAAELFYLVPEVDSQKRYDMNQFHMGFGKRSMSDSMKRFSSNQFHMGLGKRFDLNFPEKKSFHMGLGKRSVENNNLDGKDLYMYLCHPSRLAMLFEHAIDLRDVCPI